MILKHKMYINGEWVESESHETYNRVNSADPDEILGEFQKGDAIDAEKAVEAAEGAFEKRSETPPPKRAEYLPKAAQLLKDRKEELARVMTREMGKILSDSRADVQEGIDIAYCAADEGQRLLGHTTTSEKARQTIYMTTQASYRRRTSTKFTNVIAERSLATRSV